MAQSLIIVAIHIIFVENSEPHRQSFPSRCQLIIHLINKGTKVRRESHVAVSSYKLCAYPQLVSEPVLTVIVT
jgi:hypothetical protein